MSKKCMHVDPGEGTSQLPHESESPIVVTDWRYCALCQADTGENVVNPSIEKYRACTKKSGYAVIANNILAFSEIGSIPLDIDIRRLDDGQGIEGTLFSNTAVWHKTCRNKFDKQKLQRAQKRKAVDSRVPESSPVKSRLRTSESLIRTNKCFFCNNDDKTERLHSALTMNIDRRVREYAHTLNDRMLLGKLSEGDMTALDAKYHLSCLTALHNRVRKHIDDETKHDGSKLLEGLVLGELVSYIEDFRNDDVLPVFKLSDLGRLHQSRLQELNPELLSGRVNTTRLKDRLLCMIPDLRAQAQGREVVLMFEADIGEAIKIACYQSDDDDAIQLVRAARIVRKHMLSKERNEGLFDGSFQPGCEQKSVPESLLALVRMILQGPSIEDQKLSQYSNMKIALALSELLMFNTKTTSRESAASIVRHVKSRETPLPIYTSLMIHSKTRQRDIIDKFFQHGLCISYDRMLEISTDLANSVCARFDNDLCVCPSILKANVFTVGAADNIDHNPTSRTATDSFHGTAISMIQFPTVENPGNDREIVSINPDVVHRKVISPLPSQYSEVPPATLHIEFNVPPVQGMVKPDTNVLLASKEEENDWFNNIAVLIQKEELDTGDYVSWAAYHATKQPVLTRPISPIGLMPLFTEVAHSTAMIRHAMNLVANATQHVNRGQIPVIAMDQPLFTIGKQIQWCFPDTHGEDKYVVMMGGLHIEMNVLKLLGDWLDGSGWTVVLVQAGITTSGRADAMLKGSHVTRTRYAHQVTIAVLYLLQRLAYDAYKDSLATGEVPLEFSSWCKFKRDQCPQFMYWSMVLDLELLLMQLVRSFREGNFKLYVQCLGQLAPWMFSLDHTNYARWLPVHIRDMMQLEKNHPQIYDEFMKGNFVVQRSANVFSTIAIDQAHEQMNAKVKGDGGVIGLTENKNALIRWTIAGPEVTRIVEEFEHSGKVPCGPTSNHHHDQAPGFQKQFAKDVKAMVSTMEELDNPFTEDSKELNVLDTKKIMNEDVINTLVTIEKVGQQQYDTFVEERLVDCSVPITNIIHKNKMPLFCTSSLKAQSRTSHKISTLKSNCELFSRMYISCQSREGDMDDFFQHENQSAPPALSDMGKLRACAKSDLLTCLEACASAATDAPVVDAVILDGSAIVHMLSPNKGSTFQDYADKIFVPHILQMLESVTRLDIVWDRYLEHSLKETTRQKRGDGNRVMVKGTTPLPRNWHSFLRVSENKTNLYSFLAKCVSALNIRTKTVYNTHDITVIPSSGDTSLAPCDHEEADTRLLLHALHCAKQGHRKVMLRSVDTDVVVLAVAAIQSLPLDELWIAFGVKKHLRYIPAHNIAEKLGVQKSNALGFFHAFTGCDTVSSFSGVGKRTAWDTWKAFQPATAAFLTLANSPVVIPEETMSVIERFVVLLYSRTSGCTRVNEARKQMFAKGKQLEHIPPSQAALVEHTKRATYQAGHVWGKMLVPQQNLPSPAEWGWEREGDNNWFPFWSYLPEASKACTELIKCGCKKTCRPPCKCARASLPCTDLCMCAGSCYRHNDKDN